MIYSNYNEEENNIKISENTRGKYIMEKVKTYHDGNVNKGYEDKIQKCLNTHFTCVFQYYIN